MGRVGGDMAGKVNGYYIQYVTFTAEKIFMPRNDFPVCRSITRYNESESSEASESHPVTDETYEPKTN
jgi:hypothetical protein